MPTPLALRINGLMRSASLCGVEAVNALVVPLDSMRRPDQAPHNGDHGSQRSDASNLSGGLKVPRRRLGGITASNVSSFSTRSARR